MADDVRMLIETEKLDKPAVVGHGMGGKTAIALALANPALIGRLLVVDIAPVSYADRLLPYLEATRGIDVRSPQQRTLALQRMAERMPDSAAVAFLRGLMATPDQAFDERLNLEAIAAAVTTLCDFPPELLLLSSRLPARLIAGAASDRVQPAGVAALAEIFPSLQVVRIDGAGHRVHADRPAEFLAALDLE